MVYQQKVEGRLVYREIDLVGACYAELNTEIRFSVADARSGGTELLRFTITDSSTDASRIFNCAARVLRAMMRSELIQFFVPDAELSSGSTEAEFLVNKYGGVLNTSSSAPSIYVKI